MQESRYGLHGRKHHTEVAIGDLDCLGWLDENIFNVILIAF
jgi:hypothetical protein